MQDALEKRNATALVIGGGTRLGARLATRWLRLPYPVLHDPERITYEAYGSERLLGIYQQSGTVVVDADGRIVLERITSNPRRALPMAEILRAL
jgi:peroxiredoxin